MKTLMFIYTLILLMPAAVLAQSTAFNFQGRLNDGSTAAAGSVQLELRLYDSMTGRTQIDASIDSGEQR